MGKFVPPSGIGLIWSSISVQSFKSSALVVGQSDFREKGIGLFKTNLLEGLIANRYSQFKNVFWLQAKYPFPRFWKPQKVDWDRVNVTLAFFPITLCRASQKLLYIHQYITKDFMWRMTLFLYIDRGICQRMGKNFSLLNPKTMLKSISYLDADASKKTCTSIFRCR